MLPQSLTLYITMNCALTCPHCIFVANGRLNQSEMSFELILKILDDAQKNCVFLIPLAGGDPLLHPRFFDIIDACYQRNLLPLPALTGTNITEEVANKLLAHKVPSVQVSLDGPCEEINSIYRGKGTFSQILGSIENLVKCQIMTSVAVCVDKRNYESLPALLNLLYTKGIHRIKLQRWNGFFHPSSIVRERSLSDSENQWISEVISDFHQTIGRDDFVAEQRDYRKSQRPPLCVHSNGQFSLGETGEIIGDIIATLPSEAYGRILGVCQ